MQQSLEVLLETVVYIVADVVALLAVIVEWAHTVTRILGEVPVAVKAYGRSYAFGDRRIVRAHAPVHDNLVGDIVSLCLRLLKAHFGRLGGDDDQGVDNGRIYVTVGNRVAEGHSLHAAVVVLHSSARGSDVHVHVARANEVLRCEIPSRVERGFGVQVWRNVGI